jgi:recombination protein RecA
MEIITKRGSFYYYEGEQLAQGRENAKQSLREQPAACLQIENAIRSATGLQELQIPDDLLQALQPEAEMEKDEAEEEKPVADLAEVEVEDKEEEEELELAGTEAD